jgi:hypothetical protein
MILVLFSGPVSGSVPVAFANPPAMAVGLVILVAIFAWMKVKD